MKVKNRFNIQAYKYKYKYTYIDIYVYQLYAKNVYYNNILLLSAGF